MKWPPKTHIFESPASTSWPSSSGLLGHRRTYLTILESADHALFKMVRYVLLRPLRPELDGQDVEAVDSKIWVFWGPFRLKRPLVVISGE
jgi:hypothetical protein